MKLTPYQQKATIIYGPPGCGKTANAERLAEFYNCHLIIDDWCPGDETPNGALILTNTPANIDGGISYYEAIKALEKAN